MAGRDRLPDGVREIAEPIQGERASELTMVTKAAIKSGEFEKLPPEMNPEVGQTVGLHDGNGQQIPATIVAVDDEKVTVDLNHPMAGKALTFAIEVVGISETPTQTADCDSGCGCDCSSGCS